MSSLLNEPGAPPAHVRPASPAAVAPHGLSSIVARVVGWTATVFFETEVTGGSVPPGPVLIVANHPNSLLDPLIVFRAAGRPARPLAKAPLFEHPLIGAMLRALGGLPVFRRQDDPALMHLNEGTFDAAIAALAAGDAVQIYPEGITHSEPALAPLRTGAARIALQAEDRSGWGLGLRVVPIGLTYVRKTLFRGRALAVIGPPLTVGDLRARYHEQPEDAARELTARIARALEAVTLTFAEREDSELVDVAERLYARQKGWAGWREREDLAERLPRLRRFAQGLAWLRAHDPERHGRLARRVRRYGRLAGALGASDGDVPPRYEPAAVLRYAGTEVLVLLGGLPVAALGTAAWYVPYLLPRVVARVLRPPYEAIATYKLAAGMLVIPLAIVGWTLLAWWLGGPLLGLLALLLVPLAGLAALAWHERWSRVREDAVLFLRLSLQPGRRQRLAAERARLAAEFDELAEMAGADGGG